MTIHETTSSVSVGERWRFVQLQSDTRKEQPAGPHQGKHSATTKSVPR